MFLRLFDSANVLSCYRRSESVVPQQALALANSSLCLEQARLLAGSLRMTRIVLRHAASTRQQSNAAFVSAAFERVLGRSPTSRGAGRVRRLSRRPGQAACRPIAAHAVCQRAGRRASCLQPTRPSEPARDLVHVLLNHNDFVTIR